MFFIQFRSQPSKNKQWYCIVQFDIILQVLGGRVSFMTKSLYLRHFTVSDVAQFGVNLT